MHAVGEGERLIKRAQVFIFSFILLFVLTAPSIAAVTYNRKIEIENGASSITMKAGQKKRLKVNTFWFKIKISKDLRFYSSNKLVATVDRSGIVHANSPGKAYISVVNSKGDTSSVLLIVNSSSKLSILGLVVLAIPITATFLFLKSNKKARH